MLNADSPASERRTSTTNALRRPKGLQFNKSRGMFMADFIRATQELPLYRSQLREIISRTNHHLTEATEALTNEFPNETSRTHLEAYGARVPALNFRNEEALLLRYQQHKNADEPELREDAIRCRNQIVESYLPLISSVARRYQHPGVELDDLIQEGVLAVILACDKFAPERRQRLAPYALHIIVQFARRSKKVQRTVINYPERLDEFSTRIAHQEQDFRQSSPTHRPPTLSELSTLTGLRPDEILLATHWVQSPREGRGTSIDVLESLAIDQSPTSLDDLIQKETVTQVRKTLAQLDPKDENLLRIAEGIQHHTHPRQKFDQPHSLRQISRKYWRVSHEKIRLELNRIRAEVRTLLA